MEAIASSYLMKLVIGYLIKLRTERSDATFGAPGIATNGAIGRY